MEEKKAPGRDWQEKKEELLSQTLEQLEQGIHDFMTSETFTAYLKSMSSFYRYSVNNTILIAMQDPDATMVGSYTFWKEKGRYIKKGEHGIKIIAPAPVKRTVQVERVDPKTGERILDASGNPKKEEVEKTFLYFHVKTVFDVRQTEGKPLPKLGIRLLEDKVAQFPDFMAAIQKVSPVPIRFDDIRGSANGYYHLEQKEIVIQSGMSESQTMKTCIHEVAHACLHDRDVGAKQGAQKDPQTKEIEAEGTAFCVMSALLGIDSSSYSFPYISSWSSGKDMKELKASLDTIRQTAGQMIDGITGQMQELAKEREAIKEKELDTLAAALGEFIFGIDPEGNAGKKKAGYQTIQFDLASGNLDGIRSYLLETAGGDPASEKTLQARYLLEKVSRLPEVSCGPDAVPAEYGQGKELPEATFYVAECMEFPVMGEHHENISFDEALRIYEQIPDERLRGIKGIGFDLRDGGQDLGRYPLFSGGKVQRELIDADPVCRHHPVIQSALQKLEQYEVQQVKQKPAVRGSALADNPRMLKVIPEASQKANDGPIQLTYAKGREPVGHHPGSEKESVLGKLDKHKGAVQKRTSHGEPKAQKAREKGAEELG